MIIAIVTVATFAILLPLDIKKWHIIFFVLTGIFVNPGIVIGLLLRLAMNRNA